MRVEVGIPERRSHERLARNARANTQRDQPECCGRFRECEGVVESLQLNDQLVVTAGSIPDGMIDFFNADSERM